MAPVVLLEMCPFLQKGSSAHTHAARASAKSKTFLRRAQARASAKSTWFGVLGGKGFAAFLTALHRREDAVRIV